MTTGLSFYDTLNLPKNASEEDIKKAYRKLAVQKHPDKGGDPEEFKKISEAYKTLSDSQKRGIYDQLGDEGFRQHEQGGGGGDGGADFNPFDLFSHFFGGGGMGGGFGFPGRGGGGPGKKMMQHTMNVSMDDVYKGTTRKLRIKDDRSCSECESSCHACGGSGHIMQHIRMGPMVQVMQSACHACQGKGKVSSASKATCAKCEGKGKVQEVHNVDIQVPAGVSSGEQAHIPVSNNLDVLITFAVSNHPVFKRRGNEIAMEIQMTLRESFLGKIFTVPHFEGDIVINTLDYGVVYDNQKVRIPRKGFRQGPNVPRGDLVLWFYVTSLPDKASKLIANDADLRKMLKDVFDYMEKK